MAYLIEIATSDFTTTEAAVAGGADRIELCANLAEGGTTPSFGMIRMCRKNFSVSLFPIIRPRGGDFLYTDAEFAIMEEDTRVCRAENCEGIVTGLLTANGEIDLVRTRKLVELAYPMEVTFHRAFDRCRDPFTALEQLIACGCTRILTSGQVPAAPAGADLIRQLQEKAGGRIIIMPGSGVRKENIRELAQKTGCTEFHSSLRDKTKSGMQYIHPSFAGSEDCYMNNAISPNEVMALRNALEQ